MRAMLVVLMCMYTSVYAGEIQWAKITAYCACTKCCGDYPGKVRGLTSSGAMAREGLTLAMPKSYPYGVHVYLADGTLLGIKEDIGGAIRTTKGYICIDVYMTTHKKALIHGVQYKYVYITTGEVK